MVNQLSSISLSAGGWDTADVDEVPGVEISFVAEDGGFGATEEREKFGEETDFGFGGEFVVETPHSGAEGCDEVVHVLAGWHPILPSVLCPRSLQVYFGRGNCEIKLTTRQLHRIPHRSSSRALSSNGHK